MILKFDGIFKVQRLENHYNKSKGIYQFKWGRDQVFGGVKYFLRIIALYYQLINVKNLKRAFSVNK